MNVDNIITAHISSCADFLSITEPRVSLIVDALELLKVRFAAVNYDLSDKGLFDEVYSRNLYEINPSMIFLLLEKIYRFSESEDFLHKNYSLLKVKPDEPVVSYIEQHGCLHKSYLCQLQR